MSRIAQLESLLARIQQRAAEPRVARTRAFQVEAAPAAAPPVVEEVVEVEEVEAEEIVFVDASQPAFESPAAPPVAEPLPRPVSEAPPPPISQPPPITVGTHVPEYREPIVEEEPMVEAVSGEFAVAEMPAMELEELGPADEVHEIHIEEAAFLGPVVEEGRPVENIVAENVALPSAEPEEPEEPEERVSEPPESGRELVATPHESARLAVAAPATPDPNALELTEDAEPAPESARNLRVAPATPQTSDVFDLEPARIEPASPQTVAIKPEELVDAIRPAVMAADVAAYVGAARAPRPETFGVLLDAALDL